MQFFYSAKITSWRQTAFIIFQLEDGFHDLSAKSLSLMNQELQKPPNHVNPSKTLKILLKIGIDETTVVIQSEISDLIGGCCSLDLNSKMSNTLGQHHE